MSCLHKQKGNGRHRVNIKGLFLLLLIIIISSSSNIFIVCHRLLSKQSQGACYNVVQACQISQILSMLISLWNAGNVSFKSLSMMVSCSQMNQTQ